MTACISSVYQTQVSLPKVESYYKRDNWLLRGNGVGFEAFESVFQAPLLVLCSRKRPLKKERHGTENKGLISTTTFDELCLHTKKTTTPEDDNHCFCSTPIFSSANFETRQLSKILSLSLLDRRVLAKGLSHARDWNNFWSRGTGSRGTDSNNFVVAQPTT